jgi:hypothetical protein
MYHSSCICDILQLNFPIDGVYQHRNDYIRTSGRLAFHSFVQTLQPFQQESFEAFPSSA